MIKLTYCNSTGLFLEGVPMSAIQEISSIGEQTENVRYYIDECMFSLNEEETERGKEYLQSTGGWMKEEIAEMTSEEVAQKLLWLFCCDTAENLHESEIPREFCHAWDTDTWNWAESEVTTMTTCYEIYTEESVENGGVEERGVESEDVPMSYADIVRFFDEHTLECSSSDAQIGSWFSDADDSINYRTGERSRKSYHFPRDIDAELWDFIVWAWKKGETT